MRFGKTTTRTIDLGLKAHFATREILHSGVALHSDNGAPMKSQTMRAKAYDLGVTPSYSWPRVSSDNSFAESLFRTCKYRPESSSNSFKSLAEAASLRAEIHALGQLEKRLLKREKSVN